MSLTYWVYQVSGHSPTATATMMMTTYLPELALGPLAGAFVKRWPYRRTMIWTQLISAACSGLLALALKGSYLVPVYAIAFLSSSISQFYNPTRAAMIPIIVRRDLLVVANGLSQMTGNLALFLGPIIATAVYFSVGPFWSLTLDAASFLIVALMIIVARLPANQTAKTEGIKAFMIDLYDGIAYVWRIKTIRLDVLTVALVMLSGGAVNVSELYLITRNLGLPEARISVAWAVYGISMVAGSILTTKFSKYLTVNWRLVTIGIGLGGLCTLGMGCAPNLGWLLLCYVFGGAGNAAMNIGSNTLLQMESDEKRLTQVMGVFQPMITATTLIGTALGGLLAKNMDVRPVIVASGLVELAAGLIAYQGFSREKPLQSQGHCARG